MNAAELEKMKEAVKSVFRDPSNVDDMSAKQITAIYLRLKAQGKLG